MGCATETKGSLLARGALCTLTPGMTKAALVGFGFLLALCAGCGDDGNERQPAIQFLNLRVEEISPTRALVRFDTNVPTTCKAEYGTSEENLDFEASDPSMMPNQLAENHNVPLEDLAPQTTYFYRAKATDENGVTARSDIHAFTTLPAPDASAMTNVALATMGTRVAHVSSNFGDGAMVKVGNDSAWGANNAIDGSVTTEWATADDGDDAFIELDFGQARTISGVGFRSRRMTDGSSIIRSFLLVLPDESVLGPFDTPDPDQFYAFDFDPPVTTQTIRLEAFATTGGNTGAKEIQFFSTVK